MPRMQTSYPKNKVIYMLEAMRFVSKQSQLTPASLLLKGQVTKHSTVQLIIVQLAVNVFQQESNDGVYEFPVKLLLLLIIF